jgi:hypothetical protein
VLLHLLRPRRADGRVVKRRVRTVQQAAHADGMAHDNLHAQARRGGACVGHDVRARTPGELDRDNLAEPPLAAVLEHDIGAGLKL